MNKVNQITLSFNSFDSKEELYQAVATQVRTLLITGYNCSLAPKEDSVQLKFAKADIKAQEPKPYWLLDLEAVQAQVLHAQVEVELAKQTVKKWEQLAEDEEPEIPNRKQEA